MKAAKVYFRIGNNLNINQMKKILSLFISVICIALNANAQNGVIGELTWNLSENVLTISGNGKMFDFNDVAETPWYGCSFTDVVITEGVTYIGQSAFQNCAALKTVKIAASVASIGDFAFAGCRNLRSIYWYGTVSMDVSMAFYRVECSRITLYRRTNVSAWSGFNAAYFGEAGDLFWTIKGGVLAIEGNGNSEFVYFTDWDNIRKNITSVTLNGVNAKVSGRYVCSVDGTKLYFASANGSSVSIPEGVTEITEKAFYNLGITSLVVSSTVNKIGNRAFDKCSTLKSVKVLPVVAPQLGTQVFASTIKSSTVGGYLLIVNSTKENYSTWSSYFFRTMTMDEFVTNGVIVGENSTQGAWNYNESDGVLSINGAVAIPSYQDESLVPWQHLYGSISKIVIDDEVEAVGAGAFANAQVGTVVIGSQVVEIEDDAFYNVSADFTFRNNTKLYGYSCSAAKTMTLVIEEKDREGGYKSADDLFANTNVFDNVKYVRDFKSGKSGTVMLPFSYTNKSSKMKFYSLSSYNDETKTIVFEEVINLNAHTPYFWRNFGTSVSSLEAGNLVTLNSRSINLSHSSAASDGSWELYGVYSEEKVYPDNAGVYSNLWIYGSNGTFTNYSDYVWVDPYRAYIIGKRYCDVFKDGDSNNVNSYLPERSLSIEFIDVDGTTSIENVTIDNDGSFDFEAQENGIYYDLSGRRVENPTSGIYIVNGKKVLVK